MAYMVHEVFVIVRRRGVGQEQGEIVSVWTSQALGDAALIFHADRENVSMNLFYVKGMLLNATVPA